MVPAGEAHGVSEVDFSTDPGGFAQAGSVRIDGKETNHLLEGDRQSLGKDLLSVEVGDPLLQIPNAEL